MDPFFLLYGQALSIGELAANGFATIVGNIVCHIVALPFALKLYLKAKEELWKLKYFTMQKHNLKINPLKETKILQDIITV
jgi:hypothetical protein